jgi:hypothetical protein
VGQESTLHPAVVEPAAVRSATFRDVHEYACNRSFRRRKVRGSSPPFTGVGVKLGSNQLETLISCGYPLGSRSDLAAWRRVAHKTR